MRPLLAVPALLLALAATPAAAGTTLDTLPTNIEFFATTGSGGPINPEVLVGFNPQPDPPGDVARADLSNPLRPSITQTGVGNFTILFGLADPSGTPYRFTLPGAISPNADHIGLYSFLAAAGDGSVFKISFDVGGMTGNSVAFNPQPDPPGDFANSFVGFSFPGDPSLTWSVESGTTDTNGTFTPNGALSFSEVPEPSGLATLAVALGTLVLIRRRAPARA